MAAPLAPLQTVARNIGGAFEEVGRQFHFYLEVLWAIPTQVLTRLRYFGVVLALIGEITIGWGALVIGGVMVFIAFSMAIFTGSDVGLDAYQGVEQLRAQAFTGLVSSWANTREIAPLVAGVALALHVGARFTAELGAMRVSGEIDALEAKKVPALVYLVATRVVASLLIIIPLYLVALFSSFFATE